MIIKREIESKIQGLLFKGKAIIIYGPRQSGKTTLLKKLLFEHKNAKYLSCDEPDIREQLSNKTSTEIKEYIGAASLVLIDEAQRVPNIGLTIKLLVDNYPEIQVVATGSSSFELAATIREPLTGRKYEFILLPPDLVEMRERYSDTEQLRLTGDFLIFGLYPGVRLKETSNREGDLIALANDYVYKDILQFDRIKYPEKLEKLLRALAYQIGSEVKYTELASLCELTKDTVEAYIRILEQAYIIFRLEPYSKNTRRSLKRLRKIYFWDVGIRNALLRDFAPLANRNDSGQLFENFFIAEYKKHLMHTGRQDKCYFWRNYQGREIDFLCEQQKKLLAYECKLASDKETIDFKTKDAPVSQVSVVTKNNYLKFIY